MKIFKKQGVAWVVTIVLILAAVAIGQAKAAPRQGPTPEPGGNTIDSYTYVYDDAGVLSESDRKALSRRNDDLLDSMDVVVACVTTNYGGSDLYSFALDYAEDIDLGGNDFIVVLDISGENYWLIQGSYLTDLFTDDDCAAYAYDYMEADFARGQYGQALLNLTDALADWYDEHYLG